MGRPKAATKHGHTAKKPEDTVSEQEARDQVPENRELKADEETAISANATPTAQAAHNEKLAARREAKTGAANPNALANPEARVMTVDSAKEIVKKYKSGTYTEKPEELLHAERVLQSQK